MCGCVWVHIWLRVFAVGKYTTNAPIADTFILALTANPYVCKEGVCKVVTITQLSFFRGFYLFLGRRAVTRGGEMRRGEF